MKLEVKVLHWWLIVSDSHSSLLRIFGGSGGGGGWDELKKKSGIVNKKGTKEVYMEMNEYEVTRNNSLINLLKWKAIIRIYIVPVKTGRLIDFTE